jgi:hypothetical protein
VASNAPAARDDGQASDVVRRANASTESNVKSYLLLIALLLTPTASSQEKVRRIGEIDFYGSAGLDLKSIRAAIPAREGDEFTASGDAVFDLTNRVGEAVRRVTGRDPTDVSPVCCDAQGNWMVYVGLPGTSIKSFSYNPTPKGKLRLPPEATNLYRETMEVWSGAVRKGAREDDSRGYALSSDPALRAKQLAVRAYALRHERLLSRVLESSAEAEQRIVAAHFLGYARRSDAQLRALVKASRDPDETVRNNAVRALGVLIESDPRLGERVPAAGFIEMLSSGSWSDRNKAGRVLEQLSRKRDPKLLGRLRAQALDALLEMARWRGARHAEQARIILGRMAEIEEDRLQQLVKTGQVDQIIGAIKGK